MNWRINRSKQGVAKELQLDVVGGVLIISLDSIPTGLTVAEYLDYLIKNKIVIRERQRIYFRKKKFKKKFKRLPCWNGRQA